MSKISTIIWKISILLLILLNAINCGKLSVELNPKCDESIECKQWSSETPMNLVHISSQGTNETIHYLWSAITGIPPSLLIVKTIPNALLSIDWKDILQNNSKPFETALHFSPEPINSIGVQFSRLFFFNDLNKTGSYNSSYPTLDINWNDFIWKNISKPQVLSDSIAIRFTQSADYELNNASIAFDLRVDSNSGRSEDLPHLAFTQSSASLQLSVNDVQTDRDHNFNQTNRPRLMATVLVMKDLTEDNTESKSDFSTITSIDDEYTPGVFDRIYLELNPKEESKQAFLHWKPIAYNSNERIIANTLDVSHSQLENVTNEQISEANSRILESFFRNITHSSHSFNLTFGATDDENYYDKKRYNTFSLVVGLDKTPDEELSLLVKMIILVGFGLPLLVMVVSALYLIVRKIRKRNFDDLLLSQQTLDNSRQ